MQRQLALYRAASLLSGPERRIISSVDVAHTENVTVDTCTQTLRFSCSVGLFTGARGKFAVTQAGWDIARRWSEDETHARLLLQALFLPHWVTKEAAAALSGGAMPVKELAQRLQGDLPGSPRRGVCLVDWLALVFLVHRDQQNLVWPAPALHAASGSALEPVTAATAGPAAQRPDEELNALMGMTNRDLRKLPDERYIAILDNLAVMVPLLSD